MIDIEIDDIVVVDIIHLYPIIIVRRTDDLIRCRVHLHIAVITLTTEHHDRITLDQLVLIDGQRVLRREERSVIRIVAQHTSHLITVLITEDKEMARLLYDWLFSLIGTMQHQGVIKDLKVYRLRG